ncbi:MAG: hypothetical protein NVS4B7_14640 [Ktedonobacteraceae bacterium]
MLGTNNPEVIDRLQNIPSWLTLLNSGSMAATWSKEGLAQEVAEQLNYALLKGAGVLLLKNVSEFEVEQLRQALEKILRSSSPSYFCDTLNGSLMWAVTLPDGMKDVAHGHLAAANSTSYSPNGKMILTTSIADATVRVWKAATGQEMFTLRRGPGELLAAKYSPDGRSILTTAYAGSLTLWNARTGEKRLSFSPAHSPVVSATFSPDGGSIAAVNREASEHVVRIWNARTGKERISTIGSAVLYSPDRRTFRTTLDDELEIWNAVTRKRRYALPGRSPVYSPGGRYLLAKDVERDSIAIVWNIETGKPDLALLSPTRLEEGLYYSPDGASIASVDQSEGVMIWRWIGEGELEAQYIAGDAILGFGPQGKSIATWSYSAGVDQVKIWDVQTGQELLTVEGRDAVYSRDESRILVTQSKEDYSPASPTVINGSTEVWEIKSKTKLFTLMGSNAVYSPDGRTVVTTLDDGRVMLWNTANGHLLNTLGQMTVLVRLDTNMEKVAVLPSLKSFIETKGLEAQIVLPLPRQGIPMQWGTPTSGGGGGLPPFPPPPPGVPAPESPPTPPPIVQRYPEVQYPEWAEPEQPFSLSVKLLLWRSSGVALDVMVTIDAAGQRTGAEPIRVSLYATSFLFDKDSGELEIYADRDSGPLIFNVRAKAGVKGPQPITVAFWQGLNSVGEAVAVIEIAQDQDARDSTAVRMERTTIFQSPALMSDQDVPLPDVILYITRQENQGGEILYYDYEWVQRSWPRKRADCKELDRSVRQWAQEEYLKLSLYARSTPPPGLDTSERELEKIGERLYLELFSRKLKEFFQQLTADAQSFLITSNEPWIPWEMVKPWSTPSFPLDEGLKEFLCARFQLSRWYRGAEQRAFHPTMTLHKLTTIIPPLDLRFVGDEDAYFKQRLPREPLPPSWQPLSVEPLIPCSARDLLDRMSQGTVNLFHFATHGQEPSNNMAISSPSTIFLGGDGTLEYRLQPEDVMQPHIVNGLSVSAPLIFMNACHSGRLTQGVFQLEGWAQYFIDFGCSGFIGANWEVHDELAALFAKEFYEALRTDKTIAQAVQQARLVVRNRDPQNSTWLAYSLYAHPNMKT